MKLKVIMLLVLSFTILFANHLTVKGGDVTLLINGQEFEIPEDHNLTLKPGMMVCFVKGKGKVVINGKKEMDRRTKECHQVPIDDTFDIRHFLSTAEDKSIVKTATVSSSDEDAVIHRGIAVADDGISIPGTITIKPSDKEVVIYDKSYGPLPVTAIIKKADGTVTKKIVNEESTSTLFRIPTRLLNNGFQIEVTNAFGDKLLDKKISKVLYFAMEQHSQIFYEKEKHTIVDILYGTDRKRNPKKSDWEDYYTGERGELKYGVAEVSIPNIHKFGEMERPSSWIPWDKETIGEHVLIAKLEDINEKKFFSFLKSKLHNVKEKDILIFIHGYNVSFATAIRRTAQISYDLKFKGVPMAYSWPSKDKFTKYARDESSIQYTLPHLVAFLNKVVENRGDANIHIIGHSMGTRALTNALKEISQTYKGKHIFKNIILAAPDIDRDVFRESLLPYIEKTTDKITLYANSNDKALKSSNYFHSGERLGEGGDDVFVYEGLDTIDATGIDTSLLGHSYFAEKKILITDLKEVIIKSLPPSRRKSLIEKVKAKMTYWKFKFLDK